MCCCFSIRVGAGVQALALWKAVAARVGPLRFRPQAIGGEQLKELLRFGLAVQGATLAYQLGDQALRLVIGARFGAAWMRYYDLGSRAAFLVRSLAGVLLTAMVSFSTDPFVRGGPQGVARLHDLSFKYTAAITLSLTGLLLYRSADLIRLWLGAERETAPILQAFVVLAVLHGIAALGGPAAVIGRGALKPGVEAAIMLGSGALGLAGAAAAPSFVASLGFFWAAMTAVPSWSGGGSRGSSGSDGS
jgi:O-antigen/teichoic acid export membrane protein